MFAPAKPLQLSQMFAGKALQVLHSEVGPWPYPETLDLAGKACQGQTLELITKIRKLQP